MFNIKVKNRGFKQDKKRSTLKFKLLGAILFLLFIYFSTYLIHSTSTVAQEFSQTYLSGAPQSQRYISVSQNHDSKQGKLVPENSIFSKLNMENYTSSYKYSFTVKINRFWDNNENGLQIGVEPSNLSSDLDVFNKLFDISFYVNGDKYQTNQILLENEVLESNSSIDIKAEISFNENVNLTKLEAMSIRNQNFDFDFKFNLL